MPHKSENVEKSRFSHQKEAARLQRIKSQILANASLFASQGSVIEYWREYNNRRLGPYFQLKYYDNGFQRYIYIGRSEPLAEKVRQLLANLQSKRTLKRLHTRFRAALRIQKTILQNQLKSRGYYMKGFHIHKAKSK
jgi:hypothetical protein